MRALVCALGVASLWLAGIVGEALLNLPSADLTGKHLPPILALGEFFHKTFGMNAGNFKFSLSPFGVLMVGITVITWRQPTSSAFWPLFYVSWLLAMAYFSLMTWAMVAPFHILAKEGWPHPVEGLIWWIDVALASILGMAFWMATKRNGKRPLAARDR
jgi:hypothetical protein